MARFNKKIGVITFAVTAVWFVAGNFYLSHAKNAQYQNEQEAQQPAQIIKMDNVTQVEIMRHQEDGNFSEINIEFAPNTNSAELDNQNSSLKVDTLIENNTLKINLKKGETYSSHRENLMIKLPTQVQQLHLAGVNSVNISGDFTAENSVLKIDVMDCATKIFLKQLTLNRLNINAPCNVKTEQNQAANNDVATTQITPRYEYDRYNKAALYFSEQTNIKQLDVVLKMGILNFNGGPLPEKINLKVGKNVEITGNVGLFKVAKITNWSE